jgi:hypothetical protein
MSVVRMASIYGTTILLALGWLIAVYRVIV